MIVLGKHLPRRTFLKAAGATLALPLLDAMVPALSRAANQIANPGTRLSTVYLPNGIMMDKWTPTKEGTEFDLMPIMEPLAPFKSQMTVISGLTHNAGRALAGENTGDHARAGASYLTGVHPRKTEGADTAAAISMDQIAANELGKRTQFASLELCVDSPELLGQCEAGYSCAYMNSICWRTPTTPMPMEDRPRQVFERLFGDSESTDPAVRLRRIAQDKSILDSVSAKANKLRAELGPSDQLKLTEYLDAIRDVERRVQTAEEQSQRELPTLARPAGIPDTFSEHAKLMFDLQVLALQTDLTRVITFMMGREFGGRTYREIGIPEGYHALTHHMYNAGKIAKVIQIQTYHAKHLAYYLDKLRNTPDGDGSLLDHMVMLYGGGLSDGNSHLHDNLPVLLVGGASGQLKGGRHVRFPKDTPMSNLLLTMLDMAGVHQDKLGDSTGHLDLRSA
jgi:uncharacterized protein DUF1552